jgi:GntR family transcriptional regulator
MNQHTSGSLVLAAGSDRPYYRQIMDQMRQLILTGHWPPGREVPSVRRLAVRLGVSVITVQRAYHELAGEGFLVTRPGRPSQVASVLPQAANPAREHELTLLLRQVACHAGQLGLGRGEVIRRLRAVFAAEEKAERLARTIGGGSCSSSPPPDRR